MTDSELAWKTFELWWSMSAMERSHAEHGGNKPPVLFATTTKELEVHIWCGHGKPDKVVVWPKGHVVRATMMSRFGDIGITDILKSPDGYHLRVDPHDGTLTNYRREK